jgi:DNA-binding transcriptional MerR regulator
MVLARARGHGMNVRRDRTAFVGLSIGVAAEMVSMHPQTLREYERHGLVTPARTPGGARRYQDAQLARLRRIQQLTADGLSLAGVRHVLEMEDRMRDLLTRVEELESLLVRHHIALPHAIESNVNMPVRRSMSVEIVHVPRARRSPRWRNED